MRVITGSAKGRKLEAPNGQATRPTSDRIKEAIFDTIQFEIEGRRVLDLFAGSGQMGIEALSRGAAYCVFNDQAPEAVTVIRKNIQNTGFENQAKVLCSDSLKALSPGETFDIIFLDPPYSENLLPQLLHAAASYISKTGLIICETKSNEEMPDQAGELVKTKTSRYGHTKITYYRNPAFA